MADICKSSNVLSKYNHQDITQGHIQECATIDISKCGKLIATVTKKGNHRHRISECEMHFNVSILSSCIF